MLPSEGSRTVAKKNLPLGAARTRRSSLAMLVALRNERSLSLVRFMWGAARRPRYSTFRWVSGSVAGVRQPQWTGRRPTLDWGGERGGPGTAEI